MTTVAILVFPDVQALDVTGPLDVFAEANKFLAPDQRFQLEIIGTEAGPIRCSNGLEIRADLAYPSAHRQYDLLLVAGGPSLPCRKFDESLYAWLREAAGASACFGSICNGAFVLAHAGLLDGRRVTTHWNDADALSRDCPSAIVCADRLYVRDGKLVTSAGVTAGIDMSLYLLAAAHGPELALNVARRLLLFTHRAGGQSQFSPFLTPYVEPESPVAQVRQHVLANLRGDLSLAALARVANMSVRNLTRVFARDARTNPTELVERARLDAARALLETTAQPVKTIAYECGFGDAHRMRAVFRRRLGLSPQEYRAHFLQPPSADQ